MKTPWQISQKVARQNVKLPVKHFDFLWKICWFHTKLFRMGYPIFAIKSSKIRTSPPHTSFVKVTPPCPHTYYPCKVTRMWYMRFLIPMTKSTMGMSSFSWNFSRLRRQRCLIYLSRKSLLSTHSHIFECYLTNISGMPYISSKTFGFFLENYKPLTHLLRTV